MSHQIRILSIGSDPDLLAARNAVLLRAGFRVTTAQSRQEAILLASSQFFEGAVLGWSFPGEMRQQLIHDLAIVSPNTRVVLLPPPSETGCLAESDPNLLLRMVRSVVLNAS